MAKRIAILVFDGFSLVEASSIAEVFRLADELQGEGAPVVSAPAPPSPSPGPVAEPYVLAVLSSTGGSIASSATMRVWSDNLDTQAAAPLRALFIPGGRGAARLASDASFVRRLSALLQRTQAVKALGEGAAILAAAVSAAAGDALDGPFAHGQAPSTHRAVHAEPPCALDDPLGPVACALSIVKRDRGAQAARTVADRAVPGAWRRLGAVLGELEDGGTREKIDAAARWIRENFGQPISVAKAAEVAAMSERSFLRRFKTQMGITPSEYLVRARLDASCVLLAGTDLPVDKIARRCGVGSGDGLAKMFRKRLSISPTEYRLAERRRAGQR